MKREFWIVIIVLIPGLIFGAVGKPTEMGLAIVAGALSAAFLNIDKIQKFKGAGFEAEMKKAVDEAYATIENLKEMMNPLVRTTMNTLTYGGRLGGIDFEEKNEMKNSVKEVVEKFGLSDSRINECFEDFHRLHTWDLLHKFITELEKDKKGKGLVMPHQRLLQYGTNDFPSIESIKGTLEFEESNLSKEASECLENYLFYKETGDIRH